MESTKLGKYTVAYPNKKEYHSLKREIWNQEIYSFETDTNCPNIIDIGSHIGISILYFKALYPNSNILSFEPNPISFEILKENIQSNGLENVTLINKAIYSSECKKDLYIDNSGSNWDSNSSLIEHSWSGKESTKPIEISCTRLDKYIENMNEIDMLKVDIEGLETDVLNSHKNIFTKVKNIAVEYHPTKSKRVEKLISLLQPYFKIEIYHEGKQLKTPINGKLLTIKGKK